MENVTIVGTEAGVLVLATESGERFALPIDDMLQREIRRATRQSEPTAQKLAASPRDIQAQIRAGLTATEVAELLGIGVDDVARFEGPVLAEREHVIGQALAVPVLIGSEVEPDAQPTFGVAVRAKLAEIEATSERWASWKDESGWIISSSSRPTTSITMRAGVSTLAAALSRRSTPTPRSCRGRVRFLRASSPACGPWTPTGSPRRTRTRAASTPVPSGHACCRRPMRRSRTRRSLSAPTPPRRTRRSSARPAAQTTSPETADLLEALRRRRGQRETAPLLDDVEDAERPRAEPDLPVRGSGAAG